MEIEIALFFVILYDIDVQFFDTDFGSFGFKDAHVFLFQSFCCYKELESLIELFGAELEKERVIAEFVIFLTEGLVKVRDFGYVLRNVEIVVFGCVDECFDDGNGFDFIVIISVKIDIVCCDVLG